MDSYDENTKQDKQITIDVPADRVPEFYAFFGRFLAAEDLGRRGRGRGRGGFGPGGPRGGGHEHGRCGHRGEHRSGERGDQAERPAAPAAEQA